MYRHISVRLFWIVLSFILLLAIMPLTAAFNPDGFAVYQENTITSLRGDNYTNNDFTANEETLQDIGGEARYIESTWSRRRNESMVVTLDSAQDLNLVIFNMTNQSALYATELTATAPSLNHRTADVNYESLSGNGLIVWDSNTADTTISYNIWNGTSLSGTQNINLPSLSTTRRFLRLIPRQKTNDIMLIYNDALSDISAILWNGSSWGSGVYATALGAAPNDRRPMDFVWTADGNGVFFYANATGGGVYYRTFDYATSTWSDDGPAYSLGATPQALDACVNPNNNYIGVITTDSSGDANVFMWNGTAAETSPAPPSEDATIETAGHNSRCEWEKSGLQAVFFFVDANSLGIDYFYYNLSADLSSRNWSIANMATVGGTGNVATDDIETIIVKQNPYNDSIMLLYKDLTNYNVFFQVWDGVSVAAKTANAILEPDSTAGPTPSANAQSFDFLWNRYPSNPPVFTGAVNDSSNSTNPTNEGMKVTFVGRATDPEGGNWYLLVCQGLEGEYGGTCAGSEICRSATTASGGLANCTTNTTGLSSEEYEWYAYSCDPYNQCSKKENSNSPFDVNHIPTASPGLTTTTPTVATTVTCAANAVDPDSGDSVSNIYAWWLQNESSGAYTLLTGETSNQLSSPSFDSNDRFVCQVTPTDIHGFVGLAANSTIATAQNGTLSADATLANSTILRTQTTTITVSCTETIGDAEAVTLVLEDNHTGTYVQSSTTPAAVYVNESSRNVGRLASETSTPYDILITTQTAGVYGFRVQCQATDANPTQANSTVQTLTANLDTTPPIISNIDVMGITQSTATVSWDTDKIADSLVEYGTSPTMGSSTYNPTTITSHAVLLIGLLNGTTYYYNVTSCNIDNYCSESGPLTFDTLASDDPVGFVERGYCTAVVIEQGANYREGFISKGDVVDFYCETPHRIRERELLTFTFTNENKQFRKDLYGPETIYGSESVMYP